MEITSFLFLCVSALSGLEILSRIIPFLFQNLKSLIPIKGKHLDEFSDLDNRYIMINKGLTILFVYHLQYVILRLDSIEWKIENATFSNFFLSLIGFFLFYDFFYMVVHRILHLRFLYPLIHKHHHRQKAPSRGNIDGINAHPFEFLFGEYLHLLAIYLIPSHIVSIALFIIIGAFIASLNHTRFDINIPLIYSVKAHDVHHRIPESNYSQYTMFWDRIFNSYRSYEYSITVESDKDE